MAAPIIAPGPALPTAAAFAAIDRARGYDARWHMPAERAGQHIRALAAIAEAGLALRERIDDARWVVRDGDVDSAVAAAVAAYDAAVRAACGEGA